MPKVRIKWWAGWYARWYVVQDEEGWTGPHRTIQDAYQQVLYLWGQHGRIGV